MIGTGNSSLSGDDPDQERQLEADNEQEQEEEEEEEQQLQEEQEQQQLDDDVDNEDVEQEPREVTTKRLTKPKAVALQMQQSGRDQAAARRERRPKQPITTTKPIEQYREVDNPSDQYLSPGTEPSRFDILTGTGVLTPYTRKQLTNEYSRMQAIRNAFVIWQSQQEDYIIYQDAGFDETKGKTRWKAVRYQLYPMTTGQRFRITELQAKFEDLRRDIANNDRTIKRGNEQLRRTEIDLLKLKLETYFRMNIGEVDPKTKRIEDPNDEFEGSSWYDVRDMVESAEWAFQFVPKSRRIKSSEQSGSETPEADQAYGIR